MHTNLIWRGFLITIFIIVIGYSIFALYRWHYYSRLNAQTTPTTSKWTVIALAEDEHVMQSTYFFEVKGKKYQGETLLKNSIYRNSWAAQQDLPKYEKQNWTIWYDPANPNVSTLQKSFPFKECISALVLWALFLYFLWLGFYVGKFKT